MRAMLESPACLTTPRSGDVVSIYERWFGTFGKPSQALKFMYVINGLPE